MKIKHHGLGKRCVMERRAFYFHGTDSGTSQDIINELESWLPGLIVEIS